MNSARFQTISVKALSRIGIGFQVLSDNLKEVEEIKGIDSDDLLFVEFKLDREPGTLIRSKVKVHNICGGFVGAEFHAPEEHILKELGFYMMP